MAKLRWKRWLFLLHRWAGIALCLLFAAWFVSGLFMMYVEFPQLTRAERLAGEPALDFSTATLTPAAAVAHLTTADFSAMGTIAGPQQIDEQQRLDEKPPGVLIPAVVPANVSLHMLLDRPVYEVSMDAGLQPRVVFADTGEVLRAVSIATAERVVRDFAARSRQIDAAANNVQFREQLIVDQWTVSASLNDHRPLLRIALNDAAGTEYYVSSRTGVVVRDTDRRERTLNYFGAVTHWLYPTFIRRYPDAWAWMVDIVAGAGGILAVSGLWIGVLRWRRKRSPGKPAVPYRGLMRWHYFAGAIFGVTTLTWVVSGLLSMNPGKFNPPRSPSAAEQRIFSGAEFHLDDFDVLPDFDVQQAIAAELLHFDGQPYWLVSRRNGERAMLPLSKNASGPTRLRLSALSLRLMPDIRVSRSTWLTHYDDYYYSRHPERGDKPLPVLRIEFDDAAHTWFHIDGLTGQVLERSTAINRLYRWLYNGLHSWDIYWLWQRRPLWDIAVITFSAGGLLLSVLGVVVGYKRLLRAFNSGGSRL